MIDVDEAAREEVISLFKMLAPEHGDIVLNTKAGRLRVWRDVHGVVHAEEGKGDDEAQAPVAGRHTVQ